MPKIMFFITEDWAFLLLWRRLAEACRLAGWQVVVATHVNDRAADIEAAGFLLEPLPLARRGMNPWREIRTILALRAAIERQRPDILHAVAIKPILYSTLASRFGRACPVLGTLSGLGYAFTGDRASVRLLRAGLTVALRVVYRWARLTLTVQNSDDRAVLADLRIAPSTDVQVIAGGVGVDLDAWPACAPPDAPTVIFAIVARMLWDKGILEAVEACRLLKQRGIVCRLWLVGVPDPQNPTSITESQLTAWQDEQIVEWLGFRADIAAIWQQAHVALLPSYREGMPTALMEAAACGRPIITTDVPGCREVIDDGIEGLIVPARDAAALADAMETMVNDSVLRRRCGDAARLRAERLFDHRQVAAAYLNLYRSLMTTAHFP